MKESTSKFKVLEIVYDQGGFVIVTGFWQGEAEKRLACRWDDGGVGYPQTFGKPQWFLLPRGIQVDVSDILNLAKIQITFAS